MLTNNSPKSDAVFVEAPASWNTRYIIPDGFECQLTLRGETGQEVLERAQGAIAFLLKNGCTHSDNYCAKRATLAGERDNWLKRLSLVRGKCC